jgi:hypothetical protein
MATFATAVPRYPIKSCNVTALRGYWQATLCCRRWSGLLQSVSSLPTYLR